MRYSVIIWRISLRYRRSVGIIWRLAGGANSQYLGTVCLGNRKEHLMGHVLPKHSKALTPLAFSTFGWNVPLPRFLHNGCGQWQSQLRPQTSMLSVSWNSQLTLQNSASLVSHMLTKINVCVLINIVIEAPNNLLIISCINAPPTPISCINNASPTPSVSPREWAQYQYCVQ